MAVCFRYADIIIEYLRGLITGLLGRMIALETVGGRGVSGTPHWDDASMTAEAAAEFSVPSGKLRSGEAPTGRDRSGAEGDAEVCQVNGDRGISFPISCAKVCSLKGYLDPNSGC